MNTCDQDFSQYPQIERVNFEKNTENSMKFAILKR